MIVWNAFDVIMFIILGISIIGCGLVWLWNKITDKIDKHFERRNKDDQQR